LYYIRPVRRSIYSFEASGPIGSMIHIETRGKGRGAKTRLFEQALAELLRDKYPKLYAKFRSSTAPGGAAFRMTKSNGNGKE
jgi:hypothetical protein